MVTVLTNNNDDTGATSRESRSTLPYKKEEAQSEEDMPTWKALALKSLRETDMSYNEIATQVGRCRDTIIKLRKRYRIERPHKPKSGPTTMKVILPITTHHRALGIRLTMYRDNRSFSEVSDLLGISNALLKKMELGTHDFTLSQLLQLSALLGVSVQEMLEPHKIPTPSDKRS